MVVISRTIEEKGEKVLIEKNTKEVKRKLLTDEEKSQHFSNRKNKDNACALTARLSSTAQTVADGMETNDGGNVP